MDPALGPLADNGGPTLTHRPLAGSPLFNAGDNAAAPPGDYDQRGPGFERIQFGNVDIGSVEIQPAPILDFEHGFEDP